MTRDSASSGDGGHTATPSPDRGPAAGHVVDVFLTFDTELSPGLHGHQRLSPEENHRRSIEGRCARGAFGLPFIFDTLARHRLRGVFFVESLCAAVLGDDALRRLIGPVREAGHDAQLHVHTEWLRFESTPWRPFREVSNIHLFARERQREILERAVDHFRACGGGDPVAYRAGNFGANPDTLGALEQIGLRYDSSHDLGAMAGDCRLAALGPLAHARRIGALWEVPVSVFAARPGRYRHAQLGASSFRELRDALEFAWRSRLSTAVVVGHSFEFLNSRRDTPLPLVMRRFRRLCAFLSAHPDRFRVLGFDDADPGRWHPRSADVFHRSTLPVTVMRAAEQASLRLAG